MEAFSLLKYWRGGGSVAAALHPSSQATNATTTVLTAVTQHENATDSDEDCGGGGGDDGPFFDLEFTVPDEVDDSEENAHGNPNANNIGNNSNTEHHSDGDEDDDDDAIEECEREFKFTLSPSSNDRSSDDPNLSLSPSENLFFKGKLVQVEEPSSSSEPNAKPQFTASLFKSATKFRVFMSGLKKPKHNNAASSSSSDKESNNGSDSVPPEPQKKQQQPAERKHFTVKFKVEENMRSKVKNIILASSKGGNKKHNPEESPSSSSEEKRPSSSKEAMKNKYLKMVKPLYIRVSRRYGDKLRFSGQISLSSSAGKSAPQRDIEEKKGSPAKAAAESDSSGGENREPNAKSEKQVNLPSGLRIACKRLGKSRSASSAVAAAPPAALLSSNRRDDSLLQQQDGIQGAILHCKRSFNASRSESESCEVPCSVVSEMMMTTSEVSRNSTNEGRDKRA